MSVIIGSARIDERGRVSGGAAGDQKQTATPDYRGEVSLENFYVHKLGWRILRAKDVDYANKIAERMTTACNNVNIGYDQNERLGVVYNGIGTTTKTECDCSSLVRECVKEATGKDPGNFTTWNEASCLMNTGLFEQIDYANGVTLYTGDILVTKSQGHTVVVTSGEARVKPKKLLVPPAVVKNAVYRLYNNNNGEHMYTTSSKERDNLIQNGWTYEGVGWKVPTKGELKPVLRLYQPSTGQHLFTLSKSEKNSLVTNGWTYEGTAFKSGGKRKIHRLYNLRSGQHFYTASTVEKDHLNRNGWKYEGVGFCGE